MEAGSSPYLLPIFVLAFYLGLKVYPEKLAGTGLVKLAILTVGLAVVVTVVDKVLWMGVAAGNLLCRPVGGSCYRLWL